MRPVRLGFLLAALCASGCDCSDGLQLEGDADTGSPVEDATIPEDAVLSDDAATGDSGLAPPCTDPPASCIRAEAVATVEINRVLRNFEGEAVWPNYVLQGLSAFGSAGPMFLFVLPSPTSDRRGTIDSLRAQLFDETGAPSGPAMEIDEVGAFSGGDSRGDVLALDNGSSVVSWRGPNVGPEGPDVTRRTHGFLISSAGVGSTTILHEAAPSTAYSAYSDTTVAQIDGRTWIVSGGPDEVLFSPLDEPDRVLRVPTERPPAGQLRAAGLPDGRIVSAWSDVEEPAGTGTSCAAAVIGPDGVLVPATTVFPPTPDAYVDVYVYLAVSDGEVYLARYDRDDASLRESRIRVAHLDDALRRVEPDRWLNGWGGVTPGGMAIVSWRDAVWVVFQTLDARYGTSPALFAQPLALPACGYAVGEPVVVLPPHWSYLNSLLATAGDDEIWTVVAYVRDNATADLYRLVPCD